MLYKVNNGNKAVPFKKGDVMELGGIIYYVKNPFLPHLGLSPSVGLRPLF